MRTPTYLLAALLPLFAACSSGPTFTVAGKSLTVQDTNYGQADYYCGTLANGQYMVVMTDFALCDAVHQDMSERQIFHDVQETNLRLVFPSQLTVNPPVTTFTVGTSNCSDTSAEGTQAVAYFAHNADRQATYDQPVAMADSGTISVGYKAATSSQLTGTFDLHFGSDHIKGSFKALFCNGIGPGFGD